VKNTLKKLDHQANKFNALSQSIFETSQTYHAALQTLTAYGGPQWYIHGNQNNDPLIFSSYIRNVGVIALVPADMARAPVVEAALLFLQILLAQQGPVVEHPNDNDDDNDNDNGVMDN